MRPHLYDLVRVYVSNAFIDSLYALPKLAHEVVALSLTLANYRRKVTASTLLKSVYIAVHECECLCCHSNFPGYWCVHMYVVSPNKIEGVVGGHCMGGVYCHTFPTSKPYQHRRLAGLICLVYCMSGITCIFFCAYLFFCSTVVG